MFLGMMKTETIKITPDLLALLSELDEFKGAWRALGTLTPKRLNALRRVATPAMEVSRMTRPVPRAAAAAARR